MSATIVCWKPAPRGIPTADERLAMVLRLLKRSEVSEVAIYAHGTAVLRSVDGPLSLDDLMRHYDLPSEGEGSPMGDIHPVCFDDGSVLYGWEFIGKGQGGAMSILTAAEFDAHASRDSDAALLHAGLWARQQRSLDARQLTRTAYWSPS
jgi:hypothetical protein